MDFQRILPALHKTVDELADVTPEIVPAVLNALPDARKDLFSNFNHFRNNLQQPCSRAEKCKDKFANAIDVEVLLHPIERLADTLFNSATDILEPVGRCLECSAQGVTDFITNIGEIVVYNRQRNSCCDSNNGCNRPAGHTSQRRSDTAQRSADACKQRCKNHFHAVKAVHCLECGSFQSILDTSANSSHSLAALERVNQYSATQNGFQCTDDRRGKRLGISNLNRTLFQLNTQPYQRHDARCRHDESGTLGASQPSSNSSTEYGSAE